MLKKTLLPGILYSGTAMGNFLFGVIRGLVEHRVDFVLCGGLACVLHGSERTTFDIDILVRMDEDNLQRLIRFARAHRFTPRIPESLDSLLNPERRKEWIRDKGALVYTLSAERGLAQVDVFLDYPISYPELASRAVVFEAEGVGIPVSSIPDLLKAKESMADKRPRDLQDIAFLRERIENG